MPGKEVAARLARARRLEAVRIRGAKGGVIAPHRSMVGQPWTLWRLTTTLVLALGGVAALALTLPELGRLWGLIFLEARDRLFPGAPLGDQLFTLAGIVEWSLPVLAAPTPVPDREALLVASGVTAAVVLGTFLLPERWLPVRYLLRMAALLQATAIGVFALWPASFPYRLPDHVVLLLASGLVVMGLAPLLLGLTLHVFDVGLWRKALVTLALLAHLAIFLPLKALVHAWLIVHGTAVLMPLLFLLFGLLLDVLVFVAFYGWALSWKGDLELRDELPPVHLAGSDAP
ncbi:MAG: hypothetical protein ACRENB_13720 [Gemmatimonadales bacterium]